MTVNRWSQTAETNASADSTINWAEGQSPGSVNNSARAMMAAVAKYRDDMAGKSATAGTAPTYTLTTNQVFASLTDGLTTYFRCHATNTGSSGATLNVDSLGAKPLRQFTGAHIVAGRLLIGSIYGATYRLSTDEWLLHNSFVDPLEGLTPTDGGFVVGDGTSFVVETGATARASMGLQNALPFIASMVGAVADYAGASAPNGWLLCYGQAVSRTTYADLFTALSTTYGVGDGSTTFNLPDLRGRVVAGQDDMGGTSANRLTSQSGAASLNGDTLGAAGGAETHTLVDDEMPDHRHFTVVEVDNTSATAVDSAKAVQRTGQGGSDNARYSLSGFAGEPTAGFTSAAGSDDPHNNVQPTIILNKIIFTGVFS
jgi:microcystin-dependent protein